MRPSGLRRLVILAEGQFAPHSAKTAYGVIRYGRDDVVAVLDSSRAGQNVATYLPGHDIPIMATLDEALARPNPPDALLIGIAPTGGRLPDAWRSTILAAIDAGLDVLSGLHMFVGDDPEFAAAENSGSSPRNVWSPEWTSMPAPIASRIVARQAAGSLPPVGAIPMSRVFGASGRTSASANVATAGMSWPGSHSETFRPAIVESRTAAIGSVP